MGNKQKSRRTKKINGIRNIRWMANKIDKKVPTRTRILTKEEVKAKCKNGAIAGKTHTAIKRAVNEFVKKYKRVPSGIGCPVISLSENDKRRKKIVDLLLETEAIPKGAEVIVDGPLAPWIAMPTGETEYHPDVSAYNKDKDVKEDRENDMEYTTLVYVVALRDEKKTPQVFYEICGRVRHVPQKNEIGYVMTINKPGEWVSFPSIQTHCGWGSKRTIISLIYKTKKT